MGTRRATTCSNDAKRVATSRATPTDFFDLLGEDQQELIKNLVLHPVSWMCFRMEEAAGTKDGHSSIGKWKKAHGGKPHPLCTARLVCKSLAASLRPLVLLDCRVNSQFVVKKGTPRLKSEAVFLDAFLTMFAFLPTAEGTTEAFRTRWRSYLDRLFVLRLTEAMLKGDRRLKNMYAALKHRVAQSLGDVRPGTGCLRDAGERASMAMLLTRTARPVDGLEYSMGRFNDRHRRRSIEDLVSIATALP